jgi:NADH-quinone oxidoreductase subunit G
MPRQNEFVNEIWISDKTRFGHHFTRSEKRLQTPMMRRSDGRLSAVSWAETIEKLASVLWNAGGSIAAIAGSGMSNEDLYALAQVIHNQGGERLGAWPITHAGADLVAQVGVGQGTNLGTLGQGDAVLIIASDLEEEVPIWRLRLKQAHDRGAFVVVANARRTRMDDFADATLRYETGLAAHAMNAIETDHAEIAGKLANAANLVIVAGAEGLTLDGSRALMQAAANFLIKTGHVGKPNNGLMSPFPGPNGMGQHYFGFTPETTLDIAQNPPRVLIVAQAEILADDPAAAAWLDQVETVIVLGLFADALSDGKADFVLPIQSFAERDGTFTNGERRVQRFYTAQGPIGEALPAWQSFSRLGEKLGHGRAKLSAAAVMNEIAARIPAFAGITYKEVSKVDRQYPEVGGDDLYYGGTAYRNRGGLGVQIAARADNGGEVSAGEVTLPEIPTAAGDQVVIIPSTVLYNRASTFEPSALMHPRVMVPYAEVNSADAARLGITNGDVIEVRAGEAASLRVRAHVNGGAPQGSIVLPRHLTETPAPMTITVGQISKV